MKGELIFNGLKSAVFRIEGIPDVPVHVRVPRKLSRRSRLISVHHGVDRNAIDYIDAFVSWSRHNDYIVIAPNFSNEDFPKSNGYNLGNLFESSGEDLKPNSHWTFSIANEIAIQTMEHFKLKSRRYDIWGHSAGGQFVHRLLLFLPSSPIRYALVANPGWWTLPNMDFKWPYGIKRRNLPPKREELLRWIKMKMVIFRGTRDTLRGKHFRKTEEAEIQGKTRYERAGYMFKEGKKFADENGIIDFGWELIDVKNVGHMYSKMAEAAQDFLDERNSRKKIRKK